MERFSKTQKEERFDKLPEVLRDAVFSDENDEAVYSLVEKYQLADIQQKEIARICLYVFLGFLRIKDVFEELVQDVKLDSKIALAVYQELDQKVFGPYKAQIEENYRVFQAVSQDIAFPKTQEQIVLKNPLAEGAVNLKTENKIPKTENEPTTVQNMSGSIPVSLDVLGGISDKGLATSGGQRVAAKNDQSINPASGEQKIEPIHQKPDIQNPISESAPFVLHKHEEAIPIAQTQAQRGYKQMSFGSFMGSFKTPQAKQQEVSQARVEIPGIPVSAPDVESIPAVMQKNTPTQVPFSVKKYEAPGSSQQMVQVGKETAKVVHYAFDDNSLNANSKSQTPNSKQ